MRNKFINLAPNGLLALLWLGTFIVAVSWLLGWSLPFDPEPVTILLGLVAAATTSIVAAYKNLMKEREEELELEKHSFALAYGYVNNFIEPVITNLLNKIEPSDEIEFYIYIPEELSELEPRSIERILAKIKRLNYSSSVVNLEFREGRARDIMTVYKDQEDSVRYFDFPNTLLALVKMIDYNVKSDKNTSNEQDKIDLGKKYIDNFKAEIEKMIHTKNISEYVKFTDKHLKFLELA